MRGNDDMANTDRPESGKRTTPESDLRCPRCGERNPVPIVYGYPYGDMVAASFSGKIVLGGCIVEADSPTYRCRRCGREWADAGGPRVEGAAAITFGRDT
jgi:ribosomal protein L37E